MDETREFLLEDLAYSQSLLKAGYLEGVGEVPEDQPRGNLTGDPWFTDGYRLVLWVTSAPVPISGLQALPWRNPYLDAPRYWRKPALITCQEPPGCRGFRQIELEIS